MPVVARGELVTLNRRLTKWLVSDRATTSEMSLLTGAPERHR